MTVVGPGKLVRGLASLDGCAAVCVVHANVRIGSNIADKDLKPKRYIGGAASEARCFECRIETSRMKRAMRTLQQA